MIQTMWRALDPFRKLLNLRFPREDGDKHEAFRNVSMSTGKLALLSAMGVLWAVIVSFAAYYLVARYK